MKIRSVYCAFTLVAAVALSASTMFGADQTTKHVLFFSKSSGFEHSAIKRANDAPSFAETVLKELGQNHNIEFTFTKDGSVFTKDGLKKFDCIMFYTTGDLTTVGTDGNPAMSKEGKQAFLDAIRAGKGFVGVHSSTDTFHSPGGEKNSPARYKNDGANADPYIKMIGAEFIKHGKQQAGHLICVDKKFPGMSAVPDDFAPVEEWYSLKDFADNMHVLLVQDTSKMHDKIYERPNYPSTWARMYGKGRVFYTNMGHREDVWTNPVFQSVLMGGFDWTLRRVDAGVKPNIKKVTPKADVLPPME
jgi:type 1 glutamine amidotransferase